MHTGAFHVQNSPEHRDLGSFQWWRGHLEEEPSVLKNLVPGGIWSEERWSNHQVGIYYNRWQKAHYVKWCAFSQKVSLWDIKQNNNINRKYHDKEFDFDFGKVLVGYEYFWKRWIRFSRPTNRQKNSITLIVGKWNENMDRGDLSEETFCKMQQIMPL